MANLNLNKTVLGGRLTTDIELKQTQNGVPVCSFTIAVNRRMAKEQSQQTDFISCVAWRSTAEFISKYFHKGSSICVTGSIQTRSWTDQQEQKRYTTEVTVEEAYFVDSKSEGGNNSPADLPTYNNDLPQYEEVTDNEPLPW